MFRQLKQIFSRRRPAEKEIEVFFSPGEECLQEILYQIRAARRQIDICMFTITDDRIANAILDAHREGTAVRIITDDQKVHAQGSDIEKFQQAGIPLCVDPFEERHMHHKFAVFDRSVVLVGSYNWTRSASYQYEDLVRISDPDTAERFLEAFERLWREWYQS